MATTVRQRLTDHWLEIMFLKPHSTGWVAWYTWYIPSTGGVVHLFITSFWSLDISPYIVQTSFHRMKLTLKFMLPHLITSGSTLPWPSRFPPCRIAVWSSIS